MISKTNTHKKHGDFKLYSELSIGSKHDRLRRIVGRANKPGNICYYCGATKMLCWCNLNHKYQLNPSDYILLCRRCHPKYDRGQIKVKGKTIMDRGSTPNLSLDESKHHRGQILFEDCRVDKEELKHLFHDHELSTTEISNLLDYPRSHILRYLKKFSIWDKHLSEKIRARRTSEGKIGHQVSSKTREKIRVSLLGKKKLIGAANCD